MLGWLARGGACRRGGGAVDYSVRFFANTIHGTGLRKFVNHSDNEASMVALKEAAAKASPATESIPR